MNENLWFIIGCEEMSSTVDFKNLVLQNNGPRRLLKKIFSDLIENIDVEGALLIDDNYKVIASELPDNEMFIKNLPEILSNSKRWDNPDLNAFHHVMFKQFVMDHNGHKILSKRLRNGTTLLILLGKKGYTSLAMLDIENSTRKIDEILWGGDIQELSN